MSISSRPLTRALRMTAPWRRATQSSAPHGRRCPRLACRSVESILPMSPGRRWRSMRSPPQARAGPCVSSSLKARLQVVHAIHPPGAALLGSPGVTQRDTSVVVFALMPARRTRADGPASTWSGRGDGWASSLLHGTDGRGLGASGLQRHGTVWQRAVARPPGLDSDSCFAFVRRFREDPAWRWMCGWTLASGVLMTTLIAFIFGPLFGVAGGLAAWPGAAQRAYLFIYLRAPTRTAPRRSARPNFRATCSPSSRS